MIILIISVIVLWLIPNIFGLMLFIWSKKNNLLLYEYVLIIFLPKLWFLFGRHNWVCGITFGNFIFIKATDDFNINKIYFLSDEYNKRKYIKNDDIRQIVNHEMCHTKQQLFFGGLFYLIYIINYLQYYIYSGDHRYSYLNIYFEKKARLEVMMKEIYYCRRLILDISKNIRNVEEKVRLINRISDRINLIENNLYQQEK